MKPRALSVLVVDHDENMRLLVWTFLHDAGLAVAAANDAEEGFALAKIMRPDVILFDVEVSGERGESLVTMLRGDLATAWIPVVLMGVCNDPRLETPGCAGFLPKPFLRDELLDTVRHAGTGAPAMARQAA